MKKHPLNKGVLTKSGIGIGPVSQKMILERAMELALINGRRPEDANDTDFEQAERELTGGPETSPKRAILNAASEEDRWNPVPGSSGRQTPNSPSEEEDSEGRSKEAQLFEQGVKEAAHDQMLESARTARRAPTPNP